MAPLVTVLVESNMIKQIAEEIDIGFNLFICFISFSGSLSEIDSRSNRRLVGKKQNRISESLRLLLGPEVVPRLVLLVVISAPFLTALDGELAAHKPERGVLLGSPSRTLDD